MIPYKNGYKCPNCGRWWREYPDHRCTWQLGDDIEDALKSLGITKERWARLKEQLHLDPNCNCERRQVWLNEKSKELKMKVDHLRKILEKWYSRPR